MDLFSPAVWALAGLAVGILLTVARLRPPAIAARREAERLAREREELTVRLGELGEAARRAHELAARGIEEPARDAHRVMRGRGDLQIAIARDLEELERALGVGVGKGATVSAVALDFEGTARRAEAAAAEHAGRMRQMAVEADAAQQAAATVSLAAHALSEILNAFDRGADGVASAARETADAAAQMGGAQRRLGAAASETAAHSASVAVEAERGYRAVHHTLDEMDRVRELAGEARRGIEALAGRMASVGEVVRAIQEIAEKTNLLALNAAIIAAQAGEHGRSFAVVAQEIKALAARTATSTKQIGELIRGVREESERAMEAMTGGVAAVARGFEVALGAGDALGEVRQAARIAQKKVQSMTRAMDEESSAAGRTGDTAQVLADRAAQLAAVIKEQSMRRARLAEGAATFADSGARLGRLAREQLDGGGALLEAVARLVTDTHGTVRGQRELRRHVDRIHSGAAQLTGLEGEVAERVAAVSDAAGRLRAELARLSGP